MKELKEIIKLEDKLFNYQGEDKIISSHELKEELDKTQSAVFSFKTGVPSIDRILQGVEAGELIIVSGPPDGGKTTLLSSITKNIAGEIKTAWFSLEVTQRQFIKRFGEPLPLFYLPAKNTENNIQWLIERIIEAKVKYDVKMIFIDHLHQIFSIDRFNGKNLSLELGDIVAKIKQIAIDYNLVIWLVAHSIDAKEGITREPRMADVRDSGMIVRLADIVMGLWRIPNSYDGSENNITETAESDTRAKVRIWKNRREGKHGYFLMQLEGKHLMELELREDEKKSTPQKRLEKFTKQFDDQKNF